MIHRLTRIGTRAVLPTVLLGLLGVFGARPAMGRAPARVVETPERRQAASLFKRGKFLYAAGEFEGALEAFRSGFAAYPLRGFLVNIAQCHRRLGQLDEAVLAYQKFLEGPDLAPGLQHEVEEALAEVERVRAAGAPANPPEAATPVTPPSAAETSRHVDDEQPPGAQLASRDDAVVEQHGVRTEKKRVRPWVWALVGVGAVAVVTGVAVGVVLGTRSSAPDPGSLGLLDGRTR